MNGQGEFKKLTVKWQKFVNDELFNAIVKEFPYGTKITKKAMATLLVDQSWIEKVQLYTWRSARASGLNISFDNFKQSLINYKTIDGKSINAWKNSYESKIAPKLVTALNKGASRFGERLAKLSSGEYTLTYLKDLLKTVPTDSDGYKAINATLKNMIAKEGVMSQLDMDKARAEVAGYISDNIRNVQYASLIKEKTKSVLDYQGRRLAQDQLQEANVNMLVDNIANEREQVKGKEEVVLVGYWTLSPTHKSHYYAGGDPCERHANNDDGYGKGSHVGNIPIPKKDSHFGCKCKVTLKVELKK